MLPNWMINNSYIENEICEEKNNQALYVTPCQGQPYIGMGYSGGLWHWIYPVVS